MKAYILIRALVKTDVPEDVRLTDAAKALADETHSNLESIGQEVLSVFAGSPPRDALDKLGEGRDAYTLDMVERIADGREMLTPTRGILRAAVEDRDFWMRLHADAHDAIATWQNSSGPVADAIARGTMNEAFQAFIKHHEALTAILLEYHLAGSVPWGYSAAASLKADRA
jgi:hypothetical protein